MRIVFDSPPPNSRETEQSTATRGESAVHPNNGATPHAFARTADADYFKAMGIPLLRGRWFEQSDWTSPNKVAVIDELFARKRFPNGDAVGQVLDLLALMPGRLFDAPGHGGGESQLDLHRTV